MAGTLIFELLCVAGIVFMVWFLVVLSTDGKRKPRCRVVYSTAWRTKTDGESFQSFSAIGVSLRSNTNFRSELKVIAGRRVGRSAGWDEAGPSVCNLRTPRPML